MGTLPNGPAGEPSELRGPWPETKTPGSGDGPHPGERDLDAAGEGGRRRQVKPSVWSRDSIITFMSLLDATEESWSGLLA